MKKTMLILSISSVIILLSSTVFSLSIQYNSNQNQQDNMITISYHFSSPSLTTTSINDETYTRVSIDSLSTMGNPGNPQLPIKGAYILLPPKTAVKNIQIQPVNKKTYQISHPIIPSSTPIPNNNTDLLDSSVIKKNSQVYTSDIYPEDMFSTIGTYIQRGYTILILQLYPIQYHPTQNTFDYYHTLTLKVTIEPDINDQTIRPLPEDKILISNRVDNPELLDQYIEHTKSLQKDSYDFLILTHESLKQGFNRLKDYHQNKGLATKIVTLNEINPSISFGETPEDIRAFIKKEYENYGIQYVLLGGDTELVPSKILYVHGMDEDQYPMETTLPADFYFSCLDGEFNSDNDDRWGEPTDGNNGGDVDLLSEVYVGRAACDTLDDVSRFVNKTILYDSLQSTNPYLKNILMAGEYLGDYGIASWGGNYLDLLLNGSTLDNYTTQGIPVSIFNISKLYDRDHPDYDWTSEQLMDHISNNLHIINHDGHSNYGYNMKLVNYEILEMNNSLPFFDYSVGCMAGGFDNPNGYDCFAEYLTVKADNAAFSAIMNARYGFFWAYSTDGDGTRFTREFWDAVFGENIPCISKAHQDSCEDNLFLIDRSCMRWTFYGLNYFGDPSISFNIGEEPTAPHITGPSQININEPATFFVYSHDINSNELYYLFDWDDGTTSDWIGPHAPGEEIETTHEWNKRGNYEIRVKAKDETGLESNWATLSMTAPLQINKLTLREFLMQFLLEFQKNWLKE